MNCPNCGTNNLDNATVCVNCGRSLSAGAQSYTPPSSPSPGYGGGGAATAGEPIQNWLWQSIVVTLCCCLPLGVVGIIFAAQVNSKLAQGDTAGARNAAQKAKMFTLIGLGLGLLAWVIWALFFGAGMMQAIREGQMAR